MMDVLIALTQHHATHALLQIHLEFQVNFVHALSDIIQMENKLSVRNVKRQYKNVALVRSHQIIQQK
jgi:hypothetical protein